MRRARAVAAIVIACTACDKPGSPPEGPPSAAAVQPASSTSAESLYFRGEYDSAAAKWRAEADSAAHAKDTLRQATALMWLGLTAWRQGDNANARALGEKSLELKKKIAGKTDLSRSYNALGLLARDEGRLRDAAALFDEAVRSARAAGDTAGVSRAAANIALINLELGDFEKARQGFETAREAGRALGDKRVEGNALNNLGMLTIRLGDAAGAIPLIDEALDRYRAIEYTTGEQNSLAQLATAYELLGDPKRSLLLLDSASRIARAAGMQTEEASNRRLMGQVYQTMADHRRALALFAEAKALSTRLGLEQELATTLRSEAASHLALGRVELARERTLEALRIHSKEGAAWEELGDLLMLAELATIARDAKDASARLSRARSLARMLDARSARVEVALSEARIAATNGEWKSVLRILGATRADLERARADIAWEPNALRARAFARLGNLDSAVAAGRDAIAGVERVRGNIASSGLRTGFTSARADVYADQAIALLRAGRTAEAFEVADAARGRALVEHLSQARSGLERSPGSTRDVVRGESLLRQIDELTSLIEDTERAPRADRNLDDRAINGISSRIAAAEREYAEMVDRAAAADPQRAMLIGLTRVPASEVRRSLRGQEAVLEYLVTDDRTFAFVVTRSGLRQVEIPVGDSILSVKVRFVRELLGRRGTDSAVVNASLASLHEILMGPIVRAGLLRGVRNLVLVPHVSLSYLPFAALRDNRGRYLAQDYALLTLPSASAFAATRRSDSVGSSENSKVGAAVFAPFTATLPATRAEARSVRSSIGRTKAMLDDEASESAFRKVGSERRILHLATHGTLNVQNPLFSRIELARTGGASSSMNDGRLSVHELLAMRTQSPLVFLSGCETALGGAWSNEFVRGEDYATLSQAILYSGAGSAVATLWRIDDESAAIFAKHFYRHLRRMSPAEALAAAQQDMLIDGRYGNPYHWAAYQVAGSGDRIPLEQRWWGLFAR